MVKCPKCAELIQPEAKICRFCGAKFNNNVGFMPWWAWIVCAVFLLYIIGSGDSATTDADETPVALLDAKTRAECGALIAKAMQSDVITSRPAPHRIEIRDATWALIDADTKRNTMYAVACELYGKKFSDLKFSENVVVYGATSGKRLAQLTSMGVSFE